MNPIYLTKRDIRRLLGVRRWINKNIKERHTLEEIAQRANLKPYQVTAGFRQIYGMGPTTYLKKRRLEIAMKLLENPPDQTLLTIARAVGYAGSGGLIKAFQSEFHTSPGKMRTKIRKKAMCMEAQRRRSGNGYPLL